MFSFLCPPLVIINYTFEVFLRILIARLLQRRNVKRGTSSFYAPGLGPSAFLSGMTRTMYAASQEQQMHVLK